MRVGSFERLDDLVAGGFEQVGAQIERRARRECLCLGEPGGAEGLLEGGLDPFGNIAADMRRRIVERAALKSRNSVG